MNEEKHTAGESFRFQVNLGGMLDILSNHLYKSPDVFLRELLQNGADAITLRQKRQPGWTGGRSLSTGCRGIFPVSAGAVCWTSAAGCLTRNFWMSSPSPPPT